MTQDLETMEMIFQMLRRHEGFSSKPYTDTVGHTTIGYGRNLDSVGITHKEADLMLETDVHVAESELAKVLGEDVMAKLNGPRYAVLVNMMFNLGSSRFRSFKNMISAVIDEDYTKASVEMLDSKWAKQVKGRAIELSKMMRSGRYGDN